MAEARLSDGVSGITPEVAEQAVEWLVELQAEDCSDRTRKTFQHWYQASADHQRAWQRIEAVNGQMRGLTTPVGQALAQASLHQRLSRRTAVKALVLFFFSAGVLGYGWRRGWHADYSTAVAEFADHQLPDGTRIRLNTDTAVNVNSDGRRQLLALLRGELAVNMPPTSQFPLELITAEGMIKTVRPAEFLVRQYSERSLVSLIRGELQLETLGGVRRSLQAGYQCLLSRDAISSPQPLLEGTGAWQRGMVVASNMRLDQFVAELGRYRNGILRCDPAIAARRVSGTYPLDNTDQALAAVARVLNLQVLQVTPLWVSLEPA